MEVTLTATIIGEQEPCTTRDSFWNEIARKTNKEAVPDKYELEVYQKLPGLLSKSIIGYVKHNMLPAIDQPPRLSDKSLTITLASINYGGLGLGLHVIATPDFPLSADDVVKLLGVYAPEHLTFLLGGVPIGVSVGATEGSLRLSGQKTRTESWETRRTRWHYSVTNLGMLVALLASLGLLFWVFHITIKKESIENEASMRLINDLVDKCVYATRECKGTSTDGHGPIEPDSKNTDNFHSRPVVPGHTPSVSNASGGSKTFLKVGRFTIFGSGPGFDRADVVKDIIKDSATAPAEQAEAILKAIGVALDDAEKAAGAVSAWVDTYRKIFPGKQSCPTVLPKGTLLDRQVEFDFDSARLDPGMQDALKKLAETVRKENIDVLIEGHADSVGSTSYNQHLSELRAKAVRDFLVTLHVLPNQLHTKGYGEGYLWLPYQPTSALNRRVRIVQCVIGTEDRCTE